MRIAILQLLVLRSLRYSTNYHLSSSSSAAIPQAAHERVDSSNLPTSLSSFCSVCRCIIIDESGCRSCLNDEAATKLDDNTAASHREDEDTMDTSNGTTSETEEENSEEKWGLIEVIAVKDLKKKKPEMCLGEDCTLGMPVCLLTMIIDCLAS